MSEKNDWTSGVIIWMLLFVGFCGLIRLAGTIILSIPLLFATGFATLAIGGLALGFILLKRHPRKLKVFLCSLVPAVLLAPIYVPIGIAVAVYTPFWVGCVQEAFNGPDIALSATSPDGNFEAYVVNQPSIDPPNQSLFIERSDGIHFRRITKLPEDIDSIEQIL